MRVCVQDGVCGGGDACSDLGALHYPSGGGGYTGA